MGQGLATVCTPAAIFEEFIRWTVGVTVSSCVCLPIVCFYLWSQVLIYGAITEPFFGYVLVMYVSVG